MESEETRPGSKFPERTLISAKQFKEAAARSLLITAVTGGAVLIADRYGLLPGDTDAAWVIRLITTLVIVIAAGVVLLAAAIAALAWCLPGEDRAERRWLVREGLPGAALGAAMILAAVAVTVAIAFFTKTGPT